MTTHVSQKRPRFIITVLLAAVIAGTLDIAVALIQYSIKTGKDPMIVLQFIASGVFGNKAFTDNGMALYGLVFHYGITFIFSLFFFLLYPFLKKLLRYDLLIATLYGIIVWIIMNIIVLPFSNSPAIPLTLSESLIAALILIAAIGLPLSLLAHRWYRQQQAI